MHPSQDSLCAIAQFLTCALLLLPGAPARSDDVTLLPEAGRERVGPVTARTDSTRGLGGADPLTSPDPVCALVSGWPLGQASEIFADGDTARAGFAVRFDEELSPYRITSVFLLPGQVSEVEAVLLSGGEHFVAAAAGGTLTPVGDAAWVYRAPTAPGNYTVLICEMRADVSVLVNVFVMEPYSGEEFFHGYRIGAYQRLPLRNDPAYAMPAGFVRVTAANADVWVSPHFQLHQFLCKQESAYPKFLVLRTRLLTKLEMLIEALRDRGVAVHSMYVMSGYRTPWYNRAIGNATSYSRHAYGDAADVFVDNDRNGWMDDLTGDGRSNAADAHVLSRAVEAMTNDAWYAPFAGGLGAYETRPPVRGPFIHVDTRGRRARW